MCLAIISLIFARISHADEIIKPGETLTLDRAIEIALKFHPRIIAAQKAVEAVRHRVGQARAGYYPHIDISGSYTKYDPAPGTVSIPPATARPPYDRYAATATLSQTIFDFGKTGSTVLIERHNLNAAASDLRSVTNNVIFNVKQAYFGVSQSARNRKVAEQTVKMLELKLEQAEEFYKAGVRSRFDVTKARVDLSNARLSLIQAENACKMAILNLNIAMGVPDAATYEVEDILSYQKYEITFEEALQRAYSNRPDLIALEARKEAASASLSLAKSSYFPSISANAAYNWAGEEFPLETGWSATAMITFPLFSGFLTMHQAGEARANIKALDANIEAQRHAIHLEVKRAYLNLLEAEERIKASELVVEQARENLEIADGRYKAGVGNPIEVSDAEVAYSAAQMDYIQALYDYRIAQAGIELAMGAR